MESKLLFADAATIATPLLVVFAIDTQSEQDSDARPVLLGASSALEEAARTLLASGEFKASLGEIAVLHAPAALKTERLMLVGLGKAKDWLRRHAAQGCGGCRPRRKSACCAGACNNLPETCASGRSEALRCACGTRDCRRRRDRRARLGHVPERPQGAFGRVADNHRGRSCSHRS